MSLILCRQEAVSHPFLIDKLGVHIYSSQELCYIIYNHPLLVMDDFVDDHLIDFIRDELCQSFLAAKLDKWRKSKESQDDLLLIIMQECYYYTASELTQFRRQLVSYRRMHPAEFKKTKADYLFGLKQYGKAIQIYEKILEYPKDYFIGDVFLGKVWCNLGSSYARMFQTDKAFYAFDKAYGYSKDVSMIQKLYYLTKYNTKLVLKERYQSIVTDELKKAWDKEHAQAEKKAATAASVKEIDKLFKKDPIKRMAGAVKLVHQWKQDYRNMV